jgi:hypothetical protein
MLNPPGIGADGNERAPRGRGADSPALRKHPSSTSVGEARREGFEICNARKELGEQDRWLSWSEATCALLALSYLLQTFTHNVGCIVRREVRAAR